jgi:hypothetical protein
MTLLRGSFIHASRRPPARGPCGDRGRARASGQVGVWRALLSRAAPGCAGSGAGCAGSGAEGGACRLFERSFFGGRGSGACARDRRREARRRRAAPPRGRQRGRGGRNGSKGGGHRNGSKPGWGLPREAPAPRRRRRRHARARGDARGARAPHARGRVQRSCAQRGGGGGGGGGGGCRSHRGVHGALRARAARARGAARAAARRRVRPQRGVRRAL